MKFEFMCTGATRGLCCSRDASAHFESGTVGSDRGPWVGRRSHLKRIVGAVRAKLNLRARSPRRTKTGASRCISQFFETRQVFGDHSWSLSAQTTRFSRLVRFLAEVNWVQRSSRVPPQFRRCESALAQSVVCCRVDNICSVILPCFEKKFPSEFTSE